MPAQGPKTTGSETTNDLGVHDTLQHGPRSMVNELKSHSAIKDRLENVSDLSDLSLPDPAN